MKYIVGVKIEYIIRQDIEALTKKEAEEKAIKITKKEYKEGEFSYPVFEIA